MLRFSTTNTPAGRFGWLDDDGLVLASGWTSEAEELLALARLEVAVAPGRDQVTEAAISSFFDGDPTALDLVTVQQHSGPFIEEAWQVLRQVRPGERISYQALAGRTTNPAAVRAAASACAKNRTALFVPCHRVVRSDGSLGGFRYGLDCKRTLLQFEAATFGSG